MSNLFSFSKRIKMNSKQTIVAQQKVLLFQNKVRIPLETARIKEKSMEKLIYFLREK